MAEPQQTIDARTAQLLIFLSILWGGSFFFNGVAVRELPPFTIALVRVALGAAVLLPFLKMLGGALPKTAAGWFPFFGMGLLNNVIPFSLFLVAQTMISSGLASVLNATTPLFTVLVLSAFGDERLTKRRVAGVLIGLLGVFVLRGPALEGGYEQTLGMLLCLGGALSYGFSGLWGRRLLNGVPPVTSAASQLMCSTVVMTILAGAIEQPWHLPMPSAETLLALLGLAALSTSLAYLVFFRILTYSGATNVMLVTLLIPITAILLGHLVLGESVTAQQIVGAIIIGSALLVIDGRVFGLLYRRS
jgi:drug/metabolite transporter (DMT)-like permease